jgi:hypothetical protein
MSGSCSTYGREIKEACRFLVGKSERKGPLGRRGGGVKRMVLKQMEQQKGLRMRTGFI